MIHLPTANLSPMIHRMNQHQHLPFNHFMEKKIHSSHECISKYNLLQSTRQRRRRWQNRAMMKRKKTYFDCN